MNKSQKLFKKLKKEIIVEVEEETIQEKSLTQRVEKPKSEQQKKTDEDENKIDVNELLKVQR